MFIQTKDHLCTGGGLVEQHGPINRAQVEHVAVLQAAGAQLARLAGHHLLAPRAVLVQAEGERVQVERLIHALVQPRRRVRVLHLHARRALRRLHAQRLQHHRSPLPRHWAQLLLLNSVPQLGTSSRLCTIIVLLRDPLMHCDIHICQARD